MFSTSRVSVSLSQTEVNHINEMLSLPKPNYKVVRLDISVQEVTGVDELDSGEHLVSQHKHRFKGKFTSTVRK